MLLGCRQMMLGAARVGVLRSAVVKSRSVAALASGHHSPFLIKKHEVSSSASSGSRIAVVGAGSVGAAVCYALQLRQIASELLVYDANPERAKGEVDDLSDGAFITNSKVRVGTAEEAGQCDIIVITAGAKQREGESRVELIGRNLKILKSVFRSISPVKETSKIVVIANPCDVLTYFAQKLSGLPKSQVFGSGTFLDTARLREFIAEESGVAQTAVHVYALGEHGDSQFVAWSSATIAGVKLIDMPEFADPKKRQALADKTRDRAYDIISNKGATYFGVAAVTSSICQCIILNQKHIRPLSTYSDHYDVCISQLAVLGQDGIHRVLPLTLDKHESEQMQASATRLKNIIKDYEPILTEDD